MFFCSSGLSYGFYAAVYLGVSCHAKDYER